MTGTQNTKHGGRSRGLMLGLAIGLAAGAGLCWAILPKRASTAEQGGGQKMYQCPMHPQILQDHFGGCPICGMDLVVMEGSQSLMSPGPEGLVTVQIDTQRRQLIGLRTAVAEEVSLGGEIRAPVRIVAAEPRQQRVAVKTAGYVERLHADFVGRPIKKGDLLFELYSPEFLTAQREYAVAVKTQKEAPDPGRWEGLVSAARKRLEYLDAPPPLIEALGQGGEPVRCLQVFAPQGGVLTHRGIVQGGYLDPSDTALEITDLSHVWALADLYEQDLPLVKVGSVATLEMHALGNGGSGGGGAKTLRGRVVFMDPTLDPGTRTLKARLEFSNPDGTLRPEMIGEAAFATENRRALTVPQDAVLDSGHRKIVFVDVGDGYLEPREVETGRSGGGKVEILDGLEKGEPVVTRAAFLVDSESRLQSALAELGRRLAEKPGDGEGALVPDHTH